MAVNVTITIPDEHVARVVAAFNGYADQRLVFSTKECCWNFRYDPKGGETNLVFGKRVIMTLIRALVRCYELEQDGCRFKVDVAEVPPPTQAVPDGIVE